MLVLSRRVGEAIQVGDNISIKVLTIGREVRFGIEAPREIAVNREEVHKRRKAKMEPLESAFVK